MALLRFTSIFNSLLLRMNVVFQRGSPFIHLLRLLWIVAITISVCILQLYLISIIYHNWLSHTSSIFTRPIQVALWPTTSCFFILIPRRLVLLVHSIQAIWVKASQLLLLILILEIHSVWSSNLSLSSNC
jgi:hypothetical protein